MAGPNRSFKHTLTPTHKPLDFILVSVPGRRVQFEGSDEIFLIGDLNRSGGRCGCCGTMAQNLKVVACDPPLTQEEYIARCLDYGRDP